MTASKRVLTAARLDLKRNFLPHLCLALLLVLLTPVLFGLNDLDTQGSAVPLELMMPLTGILLLTPIFLPEQDPAVRDVVAVRSVPLWQTYSARALYSLLFLCLLPALLILCMGFLRSQVTPDLWLDAVSSSLLLGGLGALSYTLTDNIAAAYMVPVLYYVVYFGLGSKLGTFWLFSAMSGSSASKLPQLFLGLLLLAVSIPFRVHEKA